MLEFSSVVLCTPSSYHLQSGKRKVVIRNVPRTISPRPSTPVSLSGSATPRLSSLTSLRCSCIINISRCTTQLLDLFHRGTEQPVYTEQCPLPPGAEWILFICCEIPQHFTDSALRHTWTHAVVTLVVLVHWKCHCIYYKNICKQNGGWCPTWWPSCQI